MLDNLRKFGRTFLGKVVGAFLIVGLAGFGISNVLLDFGAQTVASVGGEDVTTREFQRAYNSDINRFGQQIGRIPTAEEAVGMGIPSSTLNRLASEAALELLARQLSLGVSDDRLGLMVRQDPTFAGTLGQFDRASFARALQNNGFTEQEYIAVQAKAARRQQLASGLLADVPVAGAAADLIARFSGDQRTIDYFIVSAQFLHGIEEPTEDELAAYLVEHQEQFRTEEARTIDLLVLSPATLADAQDVTDEEIAAEYDRTRSSRTIPERRTVQQVAVSVEQAAAFEAGLAEGRSFDELVAEAGLSVTNLGTVARSEVVDPALAAAAFELEAGGATLIPGIGGRRVVHVSAIEPEAESTLDDAREDIRQFLATQKARATYNDTLDQVEELRAASRPLAEIAERFGLELHNVTLARNGAALNDVADVPAEARERVAAAAFEAELGRLSPTVSVSASTNIWLDLATIDPARDQTLDEVRDDVAAAVREERENEALTAEVETILERLGAGEDFGEVAQSVGQFPVLSQPFERSGDPAQGIDSQVAAAAFAGGLGHYGAARNADGDQVVFEVLDIIPAAGDEEAEIRAYLLETVRQSLYAEFVSGLRDQAGMRINQQALSQVLGLEQ